MSNPVYGTAIGLSSYRESNDVIVPDGTSHAGNLILRAGRTHVEGPGWYQTLHIVLTPDEARAFAAEILLEVEGR